MRRYLTIQNFETVYLKSVPQCDDMAHFLGGGTWHTKLLRVTHSHKKWMKSPKV